MEFLLDRPANLDEARKIVAQSGHIYNQKRPHTSLKYKTPGEVHRASVHGFNLQLSNRQTIAGRVNSVFLLKCSRELTVNANRSGSGGTRASQGFVQPQGSSVYPPENDAWNN